MYGVALGYNGAEFVTWEYKVTIENEKNEYSFFWGHYFNDPFLASRDYHLRLFTRYTELYEEKKYNRKEGE
jgi:hypothetical protein